MNVEERFPLPPPTTEGGRKKSTKGRKKGHQSGSGGGELISSQEPIKVTIKGDRKSFYPPSNGYRRVVNPPANGIAIEWVYGYRGFDTNKNLWVLPKVQKRSTICHHHILLLDF